MATALIPVAAIASELPFDVGPVLQSMDSIDAIAVGDLDLDGSLDIVIAGTDATEPSLSWVDAQGTAHTIAAAFATPTGVVVFDFNCDGDLDVAAASSSLNTVAWWQNLDGAGTSWSAQTDISTAANGITDLTLININDNRRWDLAGTVTPDDDVWIWKNQQCGTSWAANAIATGTADVTQLAVGDLDRDGDPDLIGASSTLSGGRVFWWEHPAAFVGTWTRSAVGNLQGASRVAVGDFDGDHDLDVAAAGTDPGAELVWWANADGAAGQWDPAASTGHLIASIPGGAEELVVVDLDRDGRDDLIQAGGSAASQLTWHRNDPALGWQSYVIPTSGRALRTVVASDHDLDGDVDLIAAHSSGTPDVKVYASGMLGRSAAFPLSHYALTPDNFPTTDTKFGDFDRDGDLDAVSFYATTGSGDDYTLNYWNNPGPASEGFIVYGQTPFNFAVDCSSAPHCVEDHAVGDLDRDGDDDVLVGTWGSVTKFLSFCENTAGDGSAWTCQAQFHTSAEWWGTHDLELADIDGDGDLDGVAEVDDLLIAGSNRELAWLENRLDEATTTWVVHKILPGVGHSLVSPPADVDRDGDPDLFSSHGNDAWILENDGDGNFVEVDLPGISTPFFQAVMADIVPGGLPEIASSRNDRLVYYEWDDFFNQYYERPLMTIDFPGGESGGIGAPSVGDLDLDGDLDIFATETLFDGGVPVREGPFWLENRLNETSNDWFHHPDFFFAILGDTQLLDLDGDADLEAVVTWQAGLDIFRNQGGNGRATFGDTSLGVVSADALSPLFEADLEHLGRPGDEDLEIRGLTLHFADDGGADLSQVDFDAIFQSIQVQAQGGAVLVNDSAIALVDGEAALVIPPGATDGAIPCCLGSEITTLEIKAQTTPNAHQAAQLDLQITLVSEGVLLGTSGVDQRAILESGEDLAIAVVVVAPGALFSDGFESGDTSAWSSTQN